MNTSANHEPIEDYLDGLFRQLRGEPRTARRLLAEAADHLYESAAALQRDGATRIDAEREAVRRFGAPVPLMVSLRRTTWRALLTETARALVLLAGIGLVAVGLSGAVAAIFNAAFGDGFVGGASNTLEASQDAVSLRVLAGFAGLAILVATWLAQRWFLRGAGRSAVVPDWLVDVLATAAFTLGAAALLSVSVDVAVQHSPSGVGFYLSGGLVAALGAICFGVRSARALLGARAAG